ncbi:hypothetical protein PICSAR240_02103 [Mycobacterium avium subsp. paratuberculosis]|nr:hypothetical protein B0172_00704 [Mycobacterium avium subsp. paratuberculosis]OVF02118.1 hypothetical protein B0173_03940 [Mycobacterium avium subsp. paratuberculosis]QKU46053.1 hypothetical protein MAP44135_2697 [Mycobacterium avium subsp. paratuberculosis]CAG6876566.1 hypothetical protein PICSAR1_01452 [Mycobacterium avium subsp. paratuberculosis]CAG6879182.1 hypothetical protein PICSAR118_01596 [Mycobacterium avium subsp. paratuberculosis]
MASMSDRSHGYTWALPPFSRISEATFSRFSRVRATSATTPPASAIFLAAASPMPEEAPVISTVLASTASSRVRPCTASSRFRR